MSFDVLEKTIVPVAKTIFIEHLQSKLKELEADDLHWANHFSPGERSVVRFRVLSDMESLKRAIAFVQQMDGDTLDVPLSVASTLISWMSDTGKVVEV